MAEQTAAPTTESLKNCFGCKKPMKRVQKYYRNGHYFCNKNCWKTSVQETDAPKEGQK